jgi:hypothetical protein
MGAHGRGFFFFAEQLNGRNRKKKKAHTAGAGRWAPLGKKNFPIILTLRITAGSPASVRSLLAFCCSFTAPASGSALLCVAVACQEWQVLLARLASASRLRSTELRM